MQVGGKANPVALVIAEAAASRSGVGGGEPPCFAPGGLPCDGDGLLPEAALPDVLAGSPAREPAVQTDALGRIQNGETLYGTAAQLWGSARAAG